MVVDGFHGWPMNIPLVNGVLVIGKRMYKLLWRCTENEQQHEPERTNDM